MVVTKKLGVRFGGNPSAIAQGRLPRKKRDKWSTSVIFNWMFKKANPFYFTLKVVHPPALGFSLGCDAK
jgi:hypothetical protein